ncbi:hypothetical protein MNJPNG_14940 [Cupriavidus oxalaticus]|uniref:XRE family transcriptional regulator n=1 Tax=Cupriavidus oxalaticus TaxID=96344 RepID=UPI003F73F6EB
MKPAASVREKIRDARLAAMLTTDQAAAVIYTTRRARRRWEDDARAMHPALFELFQSKAAWL